jgi:hypothetical protein
MANSKVTKYWRRTLMNLSCQGVRSMNPEIKVFSRMS